MKHSKHRKGKTCSFMMKSRLNSIFSKGMFSANKTLLITKRTKGSTVCLWQLATVKRLILLDRRVRATKKKKKEFHSKAETMKWKAKQRKPNNKHINT